MKVIDHCICNVCGRIFFCIPEICGNCGNENDFTEVWTTDGDDGQ